MLRGFELKETNCSTAQELTTSLSEIEFEKSEMYASTETCIYIQSKCQQCNFRNSSYKLLLVLSIIPHKNWHTFQTFLKCVRLLFHAFELVHTIATFVRNVNLWCTNTTIYPTNLCVTCIYAVIFYASRILVLTRGSGGRGCSS